MPEIATIQTIATCDKQTLPFMLSKYQQVLEQINCAPPHVQQWLSQVEWPSWQEGYPVHFPSVTLPLLPGKHTIPTRAFLAFTMSETEEDWDNEVELGLLLEAEPLQLGDTLEYQPIVGNLVWDILKAFAFTFPETGAYLVNEGQDTHAWEVLHGKENNYWLLDTTSSPAPSFELAIVPLALVQRFQPIPERIFEQVYFDGFVGLAATYCFPIPPWITSSQS